MTHTDKGRKRKTVEQRFETWWETIKPSRYFLEEEGMSDLHEKHMRDWARMAFYKGWDASTRAKRRADTEGGK